MKSICLSVVTTFIASASPLAEAQVEYPTQTVKLVVAVPAGGALDTLARIIADKLSPKWGKPVIIENRPGGTGNVGAAAVWRAEPDGHTLLAAPPPPLVINQNLYSKLQFEPDRFVPVTVVGAVPNVLVVRSDLQVANVRELVALIRANPGKLSYASTGPGGTPHLTGEMMKSAVGADILHVPNKSAPGALLDVVSGRVDMTFANLLDALPHIEGGKVKALGLGSPKRFTGLPEVPTLAETLPGFISETWYAIVAPPGVAPGIADRIAAAITEVTKLPDVARRLRDLNVSPIAGRPDETAAFLKEETERWRRIIAKAGIKLD